MLSAAIDRTIWKRVRLTEWMKSRARVLFILFLAGALASSGLACPLWIAFANQREMPCSNQGNLHSCPFSICQASSSYLALGAMLARPIQVPAVLISSNPVLTRLPGMEWIESDDGAPPGVNGPLFLKTHSLLI